MQTVLAIDLITTDPNIRGGRPCVAGTGLRVTDVALAHAVHSRTTDDIVADYEISLAQVYAALSYYYDHKTELDEDILQQVLQARSFKDQRRSNENPLLS